MITNDDLLLAIRKTTQINQILRPLTGWMLTLTYNHHAGDHGEIENNLTLWVSKKDDTGTVLFTYIKTIDDAMYTQCCEDFLPIYQSLVDMERLLDMEYEEPGITDDTLTKWAKGEKHD